jgi:hypothetical protein
LTIKISLLDKRNKVLFDSSLNLDFPEDFTVKLIVNYFKENKARIIPQVIQDSPQQYGNVMERMGLVAAMLLCFEWVGEMLEKKIYLRA